MFKEFIFFLCLSVGLCEEETADIPENLPVEQQEPVTTTPTPEDEEKPVGEDSGSDIDTLALTIPIKARPYLHLFLKVENPSRLMAQAQVESAFNKFAKSPYAYGLMQFTPGTGKWASKSFCKNLGPFRKYDENWQVPCADKYMSWLEKRVPTTGLYCDTKKNAELGYNGGLGWKQKEAKLTSDHSHDNLVKYCNQTGRSKGACDENTTYANKISDRQPKFKSLSGVMCT